MQKLVADIQSAPLEDTGPPGSVLGGEPATSCLILHEDTDLEVGIWAVTPGVFGSVKDGVSETMHLVAGAGHIEHADGTITRIVPGTLLHLPDGWRGTWHVTQTVRKSYVIVQTRVPADPEGAPR